MNKLLLCAQLELAREHERKAISREIHDELGQLLTGLAFEISWLHRKLPAGNRELAERVKGMKALVDAGIKGVQKISAGLRPRYPDDLGMKAALDWETSLFANRTGIRCTQAIDISDSDLPPDYSAEIFRIIQEALTNVARHSRATDVAISLKHTGGGLELEIRDNGRGIAQQEIDSPCAFGLMGMRERAEILGGKLRIAGNHGTGTTVTVTIPLEEEETRQDAYPDSR